MAKKQRALEKNAFESATKGKFPASLKACDLLDKYERQEKTGNERKPRKVKGNKAVKAMQEAFRDILRMDFTFMHIQEKYDAINKHVVAQGMIYSARGILLFSISLAKFQGEKYFEDRAGLFLSALMNNCNGQDFTVNTQSLGIGLSYIGYQNTKNIIVDGNSGACTGQSMISGTITVNGDADFYVGQSMQGGKITINGNAEWHTGARMADGEIMVHGNSGTYTGSEMKGGKITVMGNVSEMAGLDMRGGEIDVKGNLGELETLRFQGGNISQRGRLIVEKGKIIGEIDNK